jgi:group I intron endonuclease
MIVYLVTNLVNGKQYIGQTYRTIKRRWNEHVWDAYRGEASYFHRAIKKHGKDSFKTEILQTCTSKAELDKQEKFYINKLKTLKPKGYNLALGGSSVMQGRKMSKKSREKMSKASLGKPKSKTHRDNISKGRMGIQFSATHLSRLRDWAESRKKNVCLRGHARTPDNVRDDRACRECINIAQRKRRSKNKNKKE